MFVSTLWILNFNTGCATLPNVTDIIDDAPDGQKSPQMVSSKGQVSTAQSKAIMERLKRSVGSTDILERHNAVVESVTDSPLTKGNKVTLIADGKAVYAEMFKAIRGAKDHINLESYIIEDDETGQKFREELLKKQRQGIQINIIYDSVGSIYTPELFFQQMRKVGAQVIEFNPVNPVTSGGKWDLTHRDHRKILIVDGKTAILGGINISQVYTSAPRKHKPNDKAPIHWRDTDIIIKGPAVAELQKLFIETWQKQKGPKLSERNYFPILKEEGKDLARIVGSTPGEYNRIPFIMYVSAITFAENSIHLTNSYFVPDKQILKALTEAAKRGVDVKIILPGITDSMVVLHAQRHAYSRLLKAGVKIYEHDSSLLHAKTAVIDNVWSTIGSTNLDFLSLLNNDEVNAVILSREFAVEVEKMFKADLAKSRQIKWEEWRNRSFLLKSREWFFNIFVRWL